MRVAFVLVFLCACRKSEAAPDAAPSASIAPTPQTSVSVGLVVVPKPMGDVVAVVHAWNEATNAHDGKKLAGLYADDVELYGTNMPRAKAVAVKEAAFAKHDRDDLSYITVAAKRALFVKKSKSKDQTTITVSGYIIVDEAMKITAEGDTTTDANLFRKKGSDCIAAIGAVVESTPDGKLAASSGNPRSIIQAQRTSDPWTVQYWMRSGPMPDGTPTYVCCPDEFEVDPSDYHVSERGRTMPPPDPALVTKARALCDSR